MDPRPRRQSRTTRPDSSTAVNRGRDRSEKNGTSKGRLLTYALLLVLLSAALYAGLSSAVGSRGGTAVGRASAPSGENATARPTSVAASASVPQLTPTPIVAPKPRPGASSISPRPTPSLPAPSAASAELPEELRDYVSGLDGTYGVAVQDLADGQTILIDADRPFPAASLYKLLVMYRVFHLIDRGELAAEDPIVFEANDLVESENGDGLSPGDSIAVGKAVGWMITFSSNPAAYALTRQIGGWNEVQEAATELGMVDTTWNGDSFVTTPADVLRFFSLLGRRALITPQASDEMVDVLLQQETNDRIPAGLPPGAKVAHKTGELPEVRNDAGIVFGDRGPYAIVILSEGIDPPEASRAQAKISRMVYERLGA